MNEKLKQQLNEAQERSQIELIRAFVAAVDERVAAKLSKSQYAARSSHSAAMTELLQELETGNSYLRRVAASKAEKLISRGSETPSAAHSAAAISEMLTRMCLGQVKTFAEIVHDIVFPKMTTEEMSAAAIFFRRVGEWFEAASVGDRDGMREMLYRDSFIRNWNTNEPFYYGIYKLLCVLSCEQPECGGRDCWETRRWGCGTHDPFQSSREKAQPVVVIRAKKEEK